MRDQATGKPTLARGDFGEAQPPIAIPGRNSCQAIIYLRRNLVDIFASRALSFSRNFRSIDRIPGLSHKSSPNGAVGILGTSPLEEHILSQFIDTPKDLPSLMIGPGATTVPRSPDLGNVNSTHL